MVERLWPRGLTKEAAEAAGKRLDGADVVRPSIPFAALLEAFAAEQGADSVAATMQALHPVHLSKSIAIAQRGPSCASA